MTSKADSVPMSTFSVRLPTVTKERLERLAQTTRRSRNFVLSEAVDRYLEIQARQIAHIEEGLADLDAGREHGHEEIEELVRYFERQAADAAPR